MRGGFDDPAARPLVPAALLGLAIATGCSGASAEQPPNLLLITLDTTRADRLGCYGRADAGTPNLDRIAGEGMLFDRAVSVGPITLPSHVSLFTGQYPPRHGVRLNGDFRLPGEGATLAEHLRGQGYATAAVVAAYVLSADFGVAQGFASFDEPAAGGDVAPAGAVLRHRAILERPAADVTDAALALFEAGKLPEPFFLWLHYYDPHGEYAPPEPFASRFRDDAYQGEIAYLDSELGRLFETLRSQDLLDGTLLAVTADHGESLGEHGENTHGLFVYDATVRVPLLLRFPGRVPAGTRSDRLVSGVDLAPTLLELLGRPPMADVEGESFAAAAGGGTMPPRAPVYHESELSLRAYGWAGLYALRDHRRKFIRAPQLEYYDLEADPGETNNVAFDWLGDVGVWIQRLGELELQWLGVTPGAAQPLDAAAREKLAALGYVAGGGTPPEREKRPNPRAYVQLHNLLLDAQSLIAHGALPQALELTQRAVELDPENPTALELSGTLLCSAGRCDEGIEHLRTAVRLAPDSYQARHNLGNALHLAGRLSAAAEAYEAAVELHPFAAEAHYALGNVRFASGDRAGAVASYREAARLDPDSAAVQAALGVALAATGDGTGARAALSRAVELDPALADAWNQLGILHEKSGEPELARARYAKALAVRPDHAGALFNDAKVCLQLGRLDEAEAGLTKLLATHPTYASGRFLEAQVRLARGDEAAAREALERLLVLDDLDPRLATSAREMLDDLGN